MLQEILDWSEVWAPVIPLIAYFLFKNKKLTGVSYVYAYVIVAVILNVLADVEWHYNHLMSSWIQSNNIFYNIHSIARCTLFSLFFIQQSNNKIEKIIYRCLLCLYFIFVVINFTAVQSILVFSSYIFSFEGILLLIMSLPCIWQIFINEKAPSIRHQPIFWIATGICIYETVNFFIFLFYSSLIKIDEYFAVHIWDIHNVFYIFFCLCLAKAIYESDR